MKLYCLLAEVVGSTSMVDQALGGMDGSQLLQLINHFYGVTYRRAPLVILYSNEILPAF